MAIHTQISNPERVRADQLRRRSHAAGAHTQRAHKRANPLGAKGSRGDKKRAAVRDAVL